MKNTTLIYVAVEGLGVELWQPVQAVLEHGNCYRVLESSPDPEHDYWQFSSGDIVRCESHTFAEGEHGLVARGRCEGDAEQVNADDSHSASLHSSI